MTQATAHPHIDEDGTVYNMGNSYGPKGPMYHIIKYDPSMHKYKLYNYKTANNIKYFNSGEEKEQKGKLLCNIPARWKMHPSTYFYFLLLVPPAPKSNCKLIFYCYCCELQAISIVLA